MPEFLEKKRPDRLVKCVLFLGELAKKNGIDRSAASNVLASAAALDEADAKKIAEQEAAEVARAKEVCILRSRVKCAVISIDRRTRNATRP